MNTKKDYYEVLGVDRDARPDAVRKAYLRLASKYHPDLNPGDRLAASLFREVQEAYEVLADDAKRRSYDRLATSSRRPPRGADSSRSPTPWPEPRDPHRGSDPEASPDAEAGSELATSFGELIWGVVVLIWFYMFIRWAC